MRVAALQLSVGCDPQQNLEPTLALVDHALNQGAAFLALPECANLLRAEDSGLDPEPLLGNPLVATLQGRAAQSGSWILIGSVLVAIPGQQKLANRQLLLSPKGELVAHYDKIHLFDVEVDDGQSYRESSRYAAGAQVVSSSLVDGWCLGHSICYDVRFPELYRSLVLSGANLLAVPAAFTRVTGEAHWHVLLRARAIETGSFLIAPAQCGTHWPGGRHTYGHSLIIDPWGKVLAEGSADETGVILADLDLGDISRCRQKVPNLKNRRIDVFGVRS